MLNVTERVGRLTMSHAHASNNIIEKKTKFSQPSSTSNSIESWVHSLSPANLMSFAATQYFYHPSCAKLFPSTFTQIYCKTLIHTASPPPFPSRPLNSLVHSGESHLIFKPLPTFSPWRPWLVDSRPAACRRTLSFKPHSPPR